MTTIAEQLGAPISRTLYQSGLRHRKQEFRTEPRILGNEKCVAYVRLDDECGNRHDSFSITGQTWYRNNVTSMWREGSGGCIHEEVAKFFPELAPFIKWHLTSTDEPMHYIANTMYHASNKDHYGRLAGEPSSWEVTIQFGDFPITSRKPARFTNWVRSVQEFTREKLAIVEVPYGAVATYRPKYTFADLPAKWHECAFDTLDEITQYSEALLNYPVTLHKVVTGYSEGKARDLDAARRCAVWPEATDEELCSDNLKELLTARHPPMMAEFKADAEKLGFVYLPGERSA